MLDNISNEQMDEIMELIYSGQKVAACRRIIEIRKKEFDDRPSLLEAKKFVEELTAELKSQYPERFSATKAGCMSAIVLFLATLSGGVGCFYILFA